MVGGANRAVLYDLYPYVWDLRNTALVAKAFICWLGEDREMEAGNTAILFIKMCSVSNYELCFYYSRLSLYYGMLWSSLLW